MANVLRTEEHCNIGSVSQNRKKTGSTLSAARLDPSKCESRRKNWQREQRRDNQKNLLADDDGQESLVGEKQKTIKTNRNITAKK